MACVGKESTKLCSYFGLRSLPPMPKDTGYTKASTYTAIATFYPQEIKALTSTMQVGRPIAIANSANYWHVLQ